MNQSNNNNTDFKLTPEREALCLLADEIEPLIMNSSLQTRKIILPIYRDFSFKVKDKIHNKGRH